MTHNKRSLKTCILACIAGLLISTAAYGQDTPDPAPTEPAVALMDAGAAVEAPSEGTAPEAATEAPPTEPGLPGEEAPAEPADADAPAELPDLGTVGEIKVAVTDGNYALAGLLMLMLIVGFLRWGAGKFEFLGFFNGKLGGYILVFTSSTGGMMIMTLTAGGSITFKVVSEAVIFGFGAIGGWEAFKDYRNRKPKADAAG